MTIALLYRTAVMGLGVGLAAAGSGQPVAAPPKLTPVFTLTVELGPATPAGRTPFGERNIIPITGGSFSGPRLKGSVIPGGWDWQLVAQGCSRLEADYMIRAEDGTVVNVLNKATICAQKGQAQGPVFTMPVFEAPIGPHQWLNDGAYVGRLQLAGTPARRAVQIEVFKAE